MNTRRDPDRLIHAFLMEGQTELADQVYDAVRGHIETTRQRVVIGPWRTNRMYSYAKLIAAAAATLVVAIGGYQLLGVGLGPDGSRPTQPTVTVPPFRPAGNGVIALAKDGDILVADRPGGDTRPLVAGPEDDRSPMFSPDGTRLAFLRNTELGSFLMIADADGTNVVQIPLESTQLEYWSFAPDGRSLMAVGPISGAYRVFIRPVDPAAAPTVLNVPLLDSAMLRDWAPPTFNPMNAQEILVVAQRELDGTWGGGLYVYDLATGGIRTIVEPADEQAFQDIAWLPDGEHIVYSIGQRPHIVASDGSGDRVFDALRGRVSPLSNDGNRIVASRVGPDMERQVIVPINGDGEPVWLTCNLATASCPLDWIWSPDDSMLIGYTGDEDAEGQVTLQYLLADPNTGQVTELDWVDVGIPAWQRVAP